MTGTFFKDMFSGVKDWSPRHGAFAPGGRVRGVEPMEVFANVAMACQDLCYPGENFLWGFFEGICGEVLCGVLEMG